MREPEHIDYDDMLDQLHGQELTDEELTAMVNEVDTDGNGEIEFPEFCELMMRNMGDKEDPETLREAFSILDADGSGTIGRDELRRMMLQFSRATEQIDDAEIDAMMDEADVDGDGVINFDEVRSALAPPVPRPRAWSGPTASAATSFCPSACPPRAASAMRSPFHHLHSRALPRPRHLATLPPRRLALPHPATRTPTTTPAWLACALAMAVCEGDV